MSNMKWYGNAVSARIKKAAMDGIEEYARVDLLPLADEKCPTDSGVMKGSHAVVRDGVVVMAGEHSDGSTFGCKKDEVVVGYGGAASAYVEKQHEDVTLHHPSGEAKWLENAFNETIERVTGKIKARVDGLR
jgi:hypothetical protein